MPRIGLSYHGGDADYDEYAHALERRATARGIPVEIVWLAGRDRPTQTERIAELDAICFTGGPDVAPERYGRADAADVCNVQPERDAAEFEMLERLQERPLPVLGICRGAQILNVFHGGTLVPDLGALNDTHRATPRKEHGVEVEAGSMLERIAGVTADITNSSHHQAIDEPAPGFCITARADDGIIEAFERSDGSAPFFLAVQWHPERMAPGLPLADAVLDAFLAAAKG